MKYLPLKVYLSLLICVVFLSNSCEGQPVAPPAPNVSEVEETIEVALQTGAEQIDKVLAAIDNKKVALVVNPTSQVNGTHLLDTLISYDIDVVKVFAPEHGFRGKADAGEKVDDSIDPKTGTPIISLYGKHKKPTAEDLAGVEMVIFDIQDVGVRFYTYISTLHYVMEACSENDLPLLVLDRPNPNGHYVDGYVREEAHKSFVGMHPIPIVHGMTIGEFATMLNGEGWLSNETQCDLTVIPCVGYDHNMPYDLPVKPSPNLPNALSIQWYHSLCFFEGTEIAVGRGTDLPFQCYGSPKLASRDGIFQFVPAPNEGAKYPRFEGEVCHGFKAKEVEAMQQLDLQPLLLMYNLYPDKDNFFLKNGFFELLAGTERLRDALIEGKTIEEIRAEWKEEVDNFKIIRSQYLLYPDFE